MKTTEASASKSGARESGGLLARVPWQLSFVGVGTMWGSSFWFIKLALKSLTPAQLTFARLVIGAGVLWTLTLLSKTEKPRGLKLWGHLFIAGALIGGGLLFLSLGETHVSSIMASIINAATPLTTLAVILVVIPNEKPTRTRVAGLILGFIGVVIIMGVWRGTATGTLVGILACLGSITCYGFMFPHSRRYLVTSPAGPAALAAGQMTCASVFVLPFAAAGSHHIGSLTTSVLLGLGGLGLFGSGLAFALNYHLVDTVGASVASATTYLSPLVAVIEGVLFLSEPISWNEPLGAVILFAGVAVSSRSPVDGANPNLRGTPRFGLFPRRPQETQDFLS